MSENIEELKRLRYKNIDFRDRLIPILEDLEKRLKTIEAEMGIYTEEEIKKIKVGGTDSD
ncbi:MAG: hypothetical protein KAU83_03930 [Bacteroidales bacterium]|nr:hypothetical protein [Bacteroidales bacterium]